MRLTLSRKALMLVSIPLAFEIVFVVSLGSLLHQVDYERAQEAHARDVATHFNNLLRILLERGSSLVFSYLTNSKTFQRKFAAGRDIALAEGDVLKRLVKDHPSEREAVAKVEALNEACHVHMETALGAMKKGNVLMARIEWAQVESLTQQLVEASEHIVQEQEAIELSLH